MPRSSATIIGIAEAAGISPSTVSLALRGDPRIKPATRDRVRELAHKLNYVPNASARSLQSGKSGLIGYLLIGFDTSFFHQLLAGISRQAAHDDYGVIASCSGSAELERQQLMLMRRKNIDGLLISGCYQENKPLIDEFAADGITVVGCSWYLPLPDYVNVETDNFRGGMLAGEYLARCGHRKVAFGALNPCVIEERIQGFGAALERVGGVTFGCARGEGEIRRLLANPDRPTAIFAHSDHEAMQIMHMAGNAGLRVPDDLSVIGFDDMPIAALSEIGLTTIAQQKEELGRLAFDVFLRLRKSEPVDRNLRLLPELVVRNSVRNIA